MAALAAALPIHHRSLSTGAAARTIPVMDPLVCYCFCVTEKSVRAAIRTHRLRTVLEVVEHTNAGMGCRGCWFDIEEMLEQFWSSAEANEPPAASVDGDDTAD